MPEKITLGSRSHVVSLRKSGEDFTIQVDDNSFEGKFSKNLDGSLEIKLDDKRYVCFSEKSGDELFVFVDGINYVFKRSPHREFGEEIEEDDSDSIFSPITGKLLDKKVEDGASVSKGDVIVILEAMKMEHRLKSPRDGKLAKLTNAEVGNQIKEGDLMFELEAE
mgnify:FL=1